MRISITAILLGLAATAQASDDAITTLAGRLATLRGEVEELATTLEARKEENRARMRSLAEQRADVEVQLRREGLRLDQVHAAGLRQREELGDKLAMDSRLRPLLLAAIDELEGTVRTGLPFRREDRLAELAKLRTQVDSGLVRAQDATYRLWQAIEDELRLTRESGLYRQTIVLEGRELLVDIARVGMVALYFRTSDERYGHATHSTDGWRYELVDDRDSRRQLRELFDAFKKQIRVGMFELPNVIATGGTP